MNRLEKAGNLKTYKCKPQATRKLIRVDELSEDEFWI